MPVAEALAVEVSAAPEEAASAEVASVAEAASEVALAEVASVAEEPAVAGSAGKELKNRPLVLQLEVKG